MTLKSRTLFITGASRGIGLAIALRAARDGANVVIAAKTDKPHPKLPGTIFTAADEITRVGGNALPVVVDVRDEAQVKSAIEQAVATFGGLDVVVNNASAVQRTPVVETDMRRFDLMHQINTRGTFMVSKYAIPHLEKAKNPHILMNSPPLDMREKWFAGSTAYSIAKYGMSLVVLGLAGELRDKGIAVNALWPRTTIATSAIKNLLGGERVMRMSRTPEIMADAGDLVRVEAPAAALETIALCHPMQYVTAVREATPKEGLLGLDADTTMSPGSFEAALRAAGGAVHAVDEVMAGKVSNAFVATRPPGHHTETARPMGFCLFNNAAIAARYAQKNHGIERAAVVDFDVHHGNGSQDIFWSDKSVMYGSTHQMPLYPGTGATSERGEHNTIVNG